MLPFSITRIYAGGRLEDGGDTRPDETGREYIAGAITAETYRHMSKTVTIWGDARFTTGEIKGVRWNNSADFALVGSYVFGDPVGGALQRQCYEFSGGYAGNAKGWGWGAETSYRAMLDYRSRDPRDKIVVSDLLFSAGGATRIGSSSLAAGIAAEARIYNQTADVAFYSPLNDIPLYAMTGLGSWHPRFSGNSGQNIAYTGTGYKVSANLFPVSASAADGFATASFGNTLIRQYLRDFNNLELTHTSTLTFETLGGMLFCIDGGCLVPVFRYGFTLKGSFFRKKGFENILGPSSGNIYPKIGERQNYTLEQTVITLSFPAEMNIGENRLDIALTGVFSSRSEKLVSPRRQTGAISWKPCIEGRWTRRLRNGIYLNIHGALSRRFARQSASILDGLDLSSDIGRNVEKNIAITAADITGYGISGGAVIPLGDKTALEISSGWSRQDYSRRLGSADAITLRAGIYL